LMLAVPSSSTFTVISLPSFTFTLTDFGTSGAEVLTCENRNVTSTLSRLPDENKNFVSTCTARDCGSPMRMVFMQK